MFFIYLISIFHLFGNSVSLLTGKFRQYSLVCHFSRAFSLVAQPKQRFCPSASSNSLMGSDGLVNFLQAVDRFIYFSGTVSF